MAETPEQKAAREYHEKLQAAYEKSQAKLKKESEAVRQEKAQREQGRDTRRPN